MNAPFNEVLSLLRRTKGISQRKAAADLNISQALLSHYENGIREPGLDFVKRACQYYEVSADFLLGRTSVNTERRETDDEFTELREGSSHESVQLLAGAMAVIFRLADAIGGERLCQEASRYMGASAYRIFRYLMQLDPERLEAEHLDVPQNRVAYLSDVEMRLSEMRFLDELEKLTGPDGTLQFQDKFMKNEFPLLMNYLEELLSRMDKRIAKHM